MTPRRLTLVRHADAEHSGPTDLERGLTGSGRLSAAALGSGLAGLLPDHALVSSALRARQTWEAMATSAGWRLEPELSEVLYGAEPESALDLVREVATGTGSLVVVGHNPTMASMAQTLDDGHGDPGALTGMLRGGFPPAAAALFELEGEWAGLTWSSARLVGYRSDR